MAMTFAYEETLAAMTRVVCSWTSDADGDAAGTTKKLAGRIVKGITVPSAVAAPTDNYNIVLTDEQGVNLLTNSQDDLQARDTANTEEVYFPLELGTAAANVYAGNAYPVFCEALTVTVSAAGDTKSGTLYLYIAPGA